MHFGKNIMKFGLLALAFACVFASNADEETVSSKSGREFDYSISTLFSEADIVIAIVEFKVQLKQSWLETKLGLPISCQTAFGVCQARLNYVQEEDGIAKGRLLLLVEKLDLEKGFALREITRIILPSGGAGRHSLLSGTQASRYLSKKYGVESDDLSKLDMREVLVVNEKHGAHPFDVPLEVGSVWNEKIRLIVGWSQEEDGLTKEMAAKEKLFYYSKDFFRQR